MAETWEKRQRQKAKKERKELKRATRDEKRDMAAEPVEELSNDELIAQFAQLNRDHGAGKIDDATFTEQRNEIWKAMGLPID